MRYFDLHCDTITECTLRGENLSANDLHVSLAAAKKYDRWAQVFAVWIPDSLRGQAACARFDSVYDTFLEEMRRNAGRIRFCRSGAQMGGAFRHGETAAFLSIEGGAALGGRIEKLCEYYQKGVRMLTLTWNGRCELGDGCMEPGAGGLTVFGREVVREMDRLGMIIDVSHLSARGFEDVACETGGAFIASHSNAKAVCGHPRNLDDGQIREIIRRGGLIGLNLYPPFLRGEQAALADILPHAEHILELGGEKTLAVGADFDGADMPPEIRGIADMRKLYALLENRFPQNADDIFFTNACNFFHRL